MKGKVNTMRKDEQIKINEKALAIYNKAMEEYASISYSTKGQRLRSCTANVYESNGYYFLVSYSTLVAVIEKSTDTLVDVLRYVYGYTSTSAKHIAKFSRDYGRGKWRCENELRYYAF